MTSLLQIVQHVPTCVRMRTYIQSTKYCVTRLAYFAARILSLALYVSTMYIFLMPEIHMENVDARAVYVCVAKLQMKSVSGDQTDASVPRLIYSTW